MGNSSIVGIGGDPIVGSDFIDILDALRGRRRDRADRDGRRDRRRRRGARRRLHRRDVSKPVVAYIAGFTAPPGKQMGHAGAIISGSSGTAEAKKEALEAKGVRVGKSPTETAQLAVEAMRRGLASCALAVQARLRLGGAALPRCPAAARSRASRRSRTAAPPLIARARPAARAPRQHGELASSARATAPGRSLPPPPRRPGRSTSRGDLRRLRPRQQAVRSRSADRASSARGRRPRSRQIADVLAAALSCSAMSSSSKRYQLPAVRSGASRRRRRGSADELRPSSGPSYAPLVPSTSVPSSPRIAVIGAPRGPVDDRPARSASTAVTMSVADTCRRRPCDARDQLTSSQATGEVVESRDARRSSTGDGIRPVPILGRRWPPTRSASPAALPAPTSCPPRRCGRRPRAALESDWERALSYGTGTGHPGPLRVDRTELHGVDPDQVMVTNGSMEAAALLFRYCVEPGDRVIVEQPTYDRTLLLLGRTGAELVPVPLEADGVDIDGVRARRSRGGPVKLAHVIPNFHNPAGCTLSIEKRERLVELAAEHGFTLFEDDPYRLISFERRARRRRCSAMDEADRVIHASSFSKTVSPGVRVGYLAGPAERDRDARQARRPSTTSRRTCWPSRSCSSSAARARLEREHRVRQRRAARAPRRAGRGAAASRSPRPSSSSPRAATSSGSTSPTTSTPPRCWTRPRSEGVAFVAGPDFMLEGGALEPAALVRERPGRADRRGRRADRRARSSGPRRQPRLSRLIRREICCGRVTVAVFDAARSDSLQLDGNVGRDEE